MSASSSSSSVRYRGETMEYFYVINNLMTFSTIKEDTIPYTSKDEKSIKCKTKRILKTKQRLNIENVKVTFLQAFKFIEMPENSDQSQQILKVLHRAIEGLKRVSNSLEKKKEKQISKLLLELHLTYLNKWNALAPSLTQTEKKIQVFQGKPTLQEKIAILTERSKNPAISIARMDLQTELSERIKNLGIVTPESIETYETELLKKKRNQKKYFNFPFLNSPLYQNLTSKISEAAMVQIVPSYVFKRSQDTSAYVSDGSKVLARTQSAVFEKPLVPKTVELRRAASQLIDTQLLEKLRSRRGAFYDES